MSLPAGNNPGMHLQDLILDTKIVATNDQKAVCLKLFKVIVKNLADPVKSKDPKYRQLRLSNEKIRSKIFPCSPSSVDYLKSLGFSEQVDTDGSAFLRIDEGFSVDVDFMSSALLALQNALKMVSLDINTAGSGKRTTSGEEEKKSPEGIISSSTNKRLAISSTSGKMSEKQRARELMEQKKKREAEEAKKIRKHNVAMLRRDKYVRENDENWKSGVSAACMKSGNGIETFRDRHGE
mmetsp:Transcript_16902/g.24783  ORF Transcript_16902/g.24783 Transcript_16902/m.24783 type:complete len:237 (+) Transcript_16902:143-853(+)|eukprot:CAMPEP_0195520296 /NCGR_PEP_ID=MMETSP0794_2-20130614/16567_1 /TAXON_ID=515487 /ORGANISM="Stephanopyxis turris, Strain CCMP 815" /LENGTH=236 /DNA_ID=CAMNT_0040649627 /DNA_START=94 /DNA_END=804 /DNA_ORIENTATION=+